ncbi:uncharacterized protein LOC106716701 [Papilio machaon]|uniref:uncharacterized protein LOC106716701 n=1 Tax=Papilio machaon TaxID=76193 RepID=UPI001E663DD9|nr:uncharacterized protein LOC106716701 [Papilio machaon]
MVKYILFMDYIRQQEIDTFFQACQKHRNYYKGNPQNYHPLTYFEEREYRWQCPSEMTTSYLTYPYYHVRYKQPTVLPHSTGRTSGIPALPERSLAARYNKPSCKAYIR